MFQSEHLVEKWKPLLDHDGGIEDSHRRAVTAVLLENQEKFLKEEAAFNQGSTLMEQPTVNTGSTTSAAGFSADAAAAGPVAGFDPVLISLIRRAMPNLVAYDLAGVQPMNGPTGLIFAMRSRYAAPGTPGMDGSEALFNEADTAFSGMDHGFDNTDYFSDVAAGFGTTSQSGTNPSVLNPVGAATSVQYNVGQGMGTADAEALRVKQLMLSTRWHSVLRR